jgi:hypothetical protein
VDTASLPNPSGKPLNGMVVFTTIKPVYVIEIWDHGTLKARVETTSKDDVARAQSFEAEMAEIT